MGVETSGKFRIILESSGKLRIVPDRNADQKVPGSSGFILPHLVQLLLRMPAVNGADQIRASPHPEAGDIWGSSGLGQRAPGPGRSERLHQGMNIRGRRSRGGAASWWQPAGRLVSGGPALEILGLGAAAIGSLGAAGARDPGAAGSA